MLGETVQLPGQNLLGVTTAHGVALSFFAKHKVTLK